MLAQSGGPARGPSRRESDTYGSTGLDYSTSYRIEADISTRIRSLLLSRQTYCPPRTPWPSDEMTSRHHEDDDSVKSFDFNTARSIADSARLHSDRLSIPLKAMPDAPYNPQILPVPKRSRRPLLRSNSSTLYHHAVDKSLDGVDGTAPSQALDDVMVHGTILACCPPCPPGNADGTQSPLGDLPLKPETNKSQEDFSNVALLELIALGSKAKNALSDSLHLIPRGERHSSLPGPCIRLVASHSSLRIKDRPLSLETTTPKSAAYRHALLKPSVTAWQPVDLGLPVQPVLITAPDISTPASNPDIFNSARSGHCHNPPLVTPVVALTKLLEIPQNEESWASGEHETLNHASETDPKSSPYLPTIKIGVEVATQNAVGPIIYQAVSPATGELDHATDPSRSPAPDPLAEAALRAEEYLRRNLSSADEGSTMKEFKIDFARENTGRVLSVSSVAQLNPPNVIFQGDVPSLDNLTPQEPLGLRMVVSKREEADEGSAQRNRIIVPQKQPSQDAPIEYSTIPPRKSSLDKQVTISRASTGSIQSRSSLLEQLVSKARPKVRATSSMSSSMTPKRRISRNDDEVITSAETYNVGVGSHWPKELLSKHKPHNTRLTAIPPRKYRHPRFISKSIRRSTTRSARSDAFVKQSGPGASEAFIRTINDLENLMSEALHIARLTAEKEEIEMVPAQSQDATALHDTIRQRTYNRGHLRSVLHSQLSDMLSYQDSVHESAPSVSIAGASQDSDMSQHINEELLPQTPSGTSYPSDNILAAQPALTPLTQSSWPLDRNSTKYAVPVLADLKTIVAGLFHKGANSKLSGLEGDSDNALAASMTIGVPKIRDGNTECAQNIRNEGPPDFPHDEDGRDMEAMAVNLRQSTQIEKFVIPGRRPYEEDAPTIIKAKRPSRAMLNQREVTEFITIFHQPPIQSRHSSLALRKTADTAPQPVSFTSAVDIESNTVLLESSSQRSLRTASLRTLNTSQGSASEVEVPAPQGIRSHTGPPQIPLPDEFYEPKDANEGVGGLPRRHISGRRLQDQLKHLKHDKLSHLNLRGKSHISLRDHRGFSLSRSHRRQPVARDWSPARKRFSASVACISTALIGTLIGIYAGEVPSIQYYIADFNHYAILGNVFFFITLASVTFLFWPLPLLHGRKPYILAALTLAMPLLFPQAISVSMQRSPYVVTWRVLLILPRTLMGAALGFANINFMATLTDLFGASLQSGNPHQETVDEFDVRRHGGGLGVWLGIWTWCYIGSIGVGFLIGALIINTLSPDWGFYVSIVIIAAVLLLNVVTPEVRRSAYRRSVTEVHNSNDISRRLARGEVMMHRLHTGPKWWGQEFHHGVMLSLDMLRQPGFLIMSVYVAWMYGQIVLVIVLLGSLMSKYYRFTSPAVGATTMAIPLGALLAVPFQKASLFSRARHRPQRTDSMTFDTKVTFSSHLVRRAIFTLVLPFAGLAYTLSSAGPPTPFILPVLFAGLIGFLSNLAIAECNGIIMETFDTSDLQPGMTGRPRGPSGERTKHKRTNYSSFPRVSSAFAIIQALGFLIGAVATGVGGVAERCIGQQAATGVMAGILLILTIGVLGILYRFKEVQIIPNHNEEDMEKWEKERKMSLQRQDEAFRQGTVVNPTQELEEPWRPIIIGNPSGKTRRMSILELGHLSRWSEIRRKNRLIDEISREARHPNLATLEDVRKEIRDKNLGNLHRGASRRSQRSKLSQGSEEPEPHV